MRAPRRLSFCRDMKKAICITLGDRSENHAGMQMYGELSDSGYSCDYLKKLYDKYEGAAQLYNLNIDGRFEPASVLVLRNGADFLLEKYGVSSDDMYEELLSLEWDSKYYDTRRNKVLNKLARHNVCFGSAGCEPDYENKIGRIVGYDEVKVMSFWKQEIEAFVGEEKGLQAEGNYYYDVKKCGIGFHGDSERRKVIGLNLGESREINWIWYQNGERISERIRVELNHGDMYLMSEKSAGFDWKKRKIMTVRHAAGAANYLK